MFMLTQEAAQDLADLGGDYLVECRCNPDAVASLLQAEGITVNWTYPDYQVMGVSGDYDDIVDIVERNHQFRCIVDMQSVKEIAEGRLRVK